MSAGLLAALQVPAHAGPEALATEQAATVPAVRHHGVLIRVPSLDAARTFYADVLGFRAVDVSPDMLRLEDDVPIYLEQVDRPLRPPADDEARAAVAFQTQDVRAAVARLRAAGVAFLSEEPFEVGVGLAVRFRDPFGNIHALLEHRVSAVPPFDEPKVYNSGLKQPDADTPALRVLFQDLGMTVRTERYYPPSLPLGHSDGSFAFMLHENEAIEPEIRPRADPDAAAVSLVFAVEDMDAVRRQVGDGMTEPRGFALGERAHLTVPSGVPIEFWRIGPAER